jgi:hypothetical protein
MPVGRTAALLLACTFYALVAPAAAQPDADAKEIAAYRLTMERVKKMMSATRAMAREMMQDPKIRESRKIEAELEALEKKDELTEADEKRMEELSMRQEQLEEEIDNPLGGDTKNLDEMEARIRKSPALVQALGKEGVAPREYATFWIVYLQAAFAHGFQKSGMLKELPKDVHPENVKFIADHEAEIQAMQKELEGLSRGKQ